MNATAHRRDDQARASLAPITTARLILRRPRIADATDLAGLANNPRVAKNTSRLPHPYSERDALAFIEAARERTGEAVFAVERRRDARLIGVVGAGTRKGTETPEIGYWIGEPFWGKGYATEAARAVVDFVFSETDADMLGAACRVANDQSRRVIEKCGFARVGAGMVKSAFYRGMVPIDRFALDRQTWLGGRGRPLAALDASDPPEAEVA